MAAGAAKPPRRTIFINAPVAQCIEHRASNAEVAGGSPVGSTNHISRRSPTAEALRSERSQCGCNSCRRDHFAPVTQRRGARLKTGSVSVRARPGAPSSYYAHVAQLAEVPISNFGQCECNSRRGHQWNANRTSEPGLFAKEIGPVNTAPGEHILRVPPFFNDRECKEPSAPPFKRVLVGASPTTVAIIARVAQQQRHCVENAASAGATPAASTISEPEA